MELVRCFIAIGLTEEIKAGLKHLQAQLKSGDQPGVKWVDPYSIHLTLKFLGNVAADRIDPITAAMEEAAQGVPPFHLEVKDLGVFPNLRRVQVAWVGIGGEVDQIIRLQKRIESNLAPLGFAPESRAFTPHLTLARLRREASPAEQPSLGELITSTKFDEVYGFSVDAINLMKSQLTREGAIYSRTSVIRLKTIN